MNTRISGKIVVITSPPAKPILRVIYRTTVHQTPLSADANSNGKECLAALKLIKEPEKFMYC
jgi:hypothetical protein